MMLKKSCQRYLNIFICILAVAVALILCEVGARVFHLSRTYDSYPCIMGKEIFADYSPKKNSYGWKDREFSKYKDASVFRIACVGDSVTEGYRLKPEDTFPKILEAKCKNAGYFSEVMNLGKCASATPQNLANARTAIEFNSDLIIYQFGLNDIRGFEHREDVSMESAVSPGNTAVKNNSGLSLKTLLRKSVLYLALAERYNYLKLKLGYRNWAFDEWDVKDWLWEKEADRLKSGFSEIRNRAQLIVIYMPYDFQVYSPRKEVFIPAERLGKLCRDNGYYFIDFTQVFKEGRKNKYALFIDDCHLSSYGCKIAGDYLYDFLLRNKIIKK